MHQVQRIRSFVVAGCEGKGLFNQGQGSNSVIVTKLVVRTKGCLTSGREVKASSSSLAVRVKGYLTRGREPKASSSLAARIKGHLTSGRETKVLSSLVVRVRAIQTGPGE